MRPATPGLHHRLSRTRHRTHTLGLALSLTLFAPTVHDRQPNATLHTGGDLGEHDIK